MKILEVNSTDLVGKRFNGYDMIEVIGDKEFDIKQSVVTKTSKNPKVVELINKGNHKIIYDKFMYYEEPKQSIKNILSITSPALMHSKEYKEADIIHFHAFHNTQLSLYAIRKIAQEKKVIISVHDPWYITGHCVYPLDCEKYKNGCNKCEHLDWYFPLDKDNSNTMWKLKKNVFHNTDLDILAYSDWMMKLIKESPVFETQKSLYQISFGIEENKFRTTTMKKARKHYGIEDDAVVFFARTQKGYKGTPYLLEALKELEVQDKKVVMLTCDTPNLLDEVKDKIQVMDLGLINDEEMANAMNACDVFLMPSTAETFGLMAIEAMSCSKPVVVFNNSALPSVTHAPECGYLVKNCDSHDLMKTLKYIIDNPKDVEKRSKLAKKIVEEEYSIDKYYDSIKEMYRKVYKRKKNSIKEDIPEPTENSEQFKYYLNDITVRLFGTKDKVSKELRYKVNDKRINDYEFDYSDIALQEVLYDYQNRLYELTDKDDVLIKNSPIIKIEKLLYLLKNNPRFILDKIKK